MIAAHALDRGRGFGNECMTGNPKRNETTMKIFKLEIECDNDAFGGDNFEVGAELARILRATAQRIERESLYPNSAQWLRDVNGNRVGTYKFESR
jgi:hypothetical protein